MKFWLTLCRFFLNFQLTYTNFTKKKLLPVFLIAKRRPDITDRILLVRAINFEFFLTHLQRYYTVKAVHQLVIL